MSLSQRANPRYYLDSVEALVAGNLLPVVNVSATGILIGGWPNPPPEGTNGAFTLRAPIENGVASMEISGTVVRVQPDGGVALTYDLPDKSWPRLLAWLDKQERSARV